MAVAVAEDGLRRPAEAALPSVLLPPEGLDVADRPVLAVGLLPPMSSDPSALSASQLSALRG